MATPETYNVVDDPEDPYIEVTTQKKRTLTLSQVLKTKAEMDSYLAEFVSKGVSIE